MIGGEELPKSSSQQIDHSPLRACLIESGSSAIEIAQTTGISLPKILKLMGLSGGRVGKDQIDGFELVRLCTYAGLPFSAVVRMEDFE